MGCSGVRLDGISYANDQNSHQLVTNCSGYCAQRGICNGPVSVCLSVASRCSVEKSGRIWLVSGVDAMFCV